jgi:hypothetical protein
LDSAKLAGRASVKVADSAVASCWRTLFTVPARFG